MLASGSQILTFSSSMNVEKGWRSGKKAIFFYEFPILPIALLFEICYDEPDFTGFFRGFDRFGQFRNE
jgi:hypothetical protein